MASALVRSQSRAGAAAARQPSVLRRKRLCTIIGEMGSLDLPESDMSLETFRAWVHSDLVPEKGVRLCYLDGEVWIDMSKGQVFSHNQVKLQYEIVLGTLTKHDRLGRFFPDGMLLVNRDANLGAGPDGIFVSEKSLRSGRVRFVEGKKGGYVEIEGSPDMVLEIVSDGSVTKDTEKLLELYWRAGIREYWLVDVRGESVFFESYRHTSKCYVATTKERGWVKSKVFGKSFRLTQGTDERGNPEFTLAVK
jgi:Uma2 family endonuclease